MRIKKKSTFYPLPMLILLFLSCEQTDNTPTKPEINQKPVAVDDFVSGNYKDVLIIDVLYNDYDPDLDPLSVIAITEPAVGTASIIDNKIKYTPSPETFRETVNLYYTAYDSKLTDTGKVTIKFNSEDIPIK